MSGNWKTNIGQSILEEINVEPRYKTWIDEISVMFGGLDICSIEVMVAKDGKEYIIEVNDSATTLMGESQEEDRKNIADLVVRHMEEKCKPPVGIPTAPSGGGPPPVARTASRSSISRSSIGDVAKAASAAAAAKPAAAAPPSRPSEVPSTSGKVPSRTRHDSQGKITQI